MAFVDRGTRAAPPSKADRLVPINQFRRDDGAVGVQECPGQPLDVRVELLEDTVVAAALVALATLLPLTTRSWFDSPVTAASDQQSEAQLLASRSLERVDVGL